MKEFWLAFQFFFMAGCTISGVAQRDIIACQEFRTLAAKYQDISCLSCEVVYSLFNDKKGSLLQKEVGHFFFSPERYFSSIGSYQVIMDSSVFLSIDKDMKSIEIFLPEKKFKDRFKPFIIDSLIGLYENIDLKEIDHENNVLRLSPKSGLIKSLEYYYSKDYDLTKIVLYQWEEVLLKDGKFGKEYRRLEIELNNVTFDADVKSIQLPENFVKKTNERYHSTTKYKDYELHDYTRE